MAENKVIIDVEVQGVQDAQKNLQKIEVSATEIGSSVKGVGESFKGVGAVVSAQGGVMGEAFNSLGESVDSWRQKWNAGIYGNAWTYFRNSWRFGVGNRSV